MLRWVEERLHQLETKNNDNDGFNTWLTPLIPDVVLDEESEALETNKHLTLMMKQLCHILRGSGKTRKIEMEDICHQPSISDVIKEPF